MPHFPQFSQQQPEANSPTPLDTTSHVLASLQPPEAKNTPSLTKTFVRSKVPPQYFSHSGYFLVRFADPVVAYFYASLKPSTLLSRTSGYWPGTEGHLSISKSLPSTVSAQLGNPANIDSRLQRLRHRPPPLPLTSISPATADDASPFAKFVHGCRVRQAATSHPCTHTPAAAAKPIRGEGTKIRGFVTRIHPASPKQTPCRSCDY